MNVAIIKYNAGNIRSVAFALERLGIAANITDDAQEILAADKVILPGVGAAGSAMEYLKEKGLDKVILKVQRPLLGICLGMQLMCSYSEEGDTTSLGIFEESVGKMTRGKIPHMGWNEVTQLKGPLFKGLPEKSFMYFVHSYCAPVSNSTVAVSDHIIPFSAAMQKNNFYGVQFHPEKSGDDGAALLKNFLAI
jgi:glutamine amidotransferase